MRVKWLTHRGKKILFTDYSNVKSQPEMISILHESIKVVKATPGKVLSLSDVTNAGTGPDFMKEAKVLGKEILFKRDKSAIIGITGLKGMLLNAYNLFSGDTMKPFTEKEEALDYLTS